MRLSLLIWELVFEFNFSFFMLISCYDQVANCEDKHL